MALAIADKRISREDYLQGELASEIRHEYVAGNVYAMSGGTLNHALKNHEERQGKDLLDVRFLMLENKGGRKMCGSFQVCTRRARR